METKKSQTRKKVAQVFLCKNCDYTCCRKYDFDKHLATVKHSANAIYEFGDAGDKKVVQVFLCKNCDYTCCRKYDFDKHLATVKHSANAIYEFGDAGDKKVANYECMQCKKVYSSRNGLWKHAKECKIGVSDIGLTHITHLADETINIRNPVDDVSSSELKVLTNLVLEMAKNNTEMQNQHKELQKQIIEACKNTTIQNTITSNSNNNNNNNNNNKTFNLMFFLNEQCKDAMNMSEFVESFNLQLSDLESVGNLGYVDGMTKIFVDKLNSMDVYKRPIHCSDAKREILYIKEENRWEREKPSNPKLRRAVKTITFQNMKLANLWSDTYPESKCNESSLNDVYMKLVIQSTGGSGEISDNENKIIRRITKEIVIEKK